MSIRAELEALMNAPFTVPQRGSRPGIKKTGYASAPGTGPAGETCRTCKHLFRNRMAKTYLKCGLMSAFWTGGAGTDVKARSPACKLWEKPDAEQTQG